MNYKKTLLPITVFLLLSVFVIYMSRNIGVPLKDIFAGLFTYALYILLIVFYILRFALVFLGVFAVYRMLRERYNKRLAI